MNFYLALESREYSHDDTVEFKLGRKMIVYLLVDCYEVEKKRRKKRKRKKRKRKKKEKNRKKRKRKKKMKKALKKKNKKSSNNCANKYGVLV